MNQEHPLPPEFTEWLARLVDQSISDEQFALLNIELERNPEALEYYLNFITTYAGLMDLGHLTPIPQINLGITPPEEKVPALCSNDHSRKTQVVEFAPDITAEERRRRIEEYANQELNAFLEQKDATSQVQSSLAVDCALREVVQGIIEGFSRLLGVTVQTLKIGISVAVTLSLLFAIGYLIYYHLPVATLSDSIHAKWETAPESLELQRGWMHLHEGYAEITFNQGARAIVQAPCRLRLNSKNKMQLESGSITAWVPPSAVGFTILTPDTRVKDFGTEFGVSVDATHASEIHVFKGEVGVSSHRRSQSSPEQRVKQGQMALKDRQGQILVESSPQEVQTFSRQLSRTRLLGIPGKQMNLADIVGGGNGFGTGTLGGHSYNAQGSINPITGNINDTFRWGDKPDNELPYDNPHQHQPCEYIPVSELPFVDGIFVPNGSENTPMVVSSLGHCLTSCPPTDGQMKWNIINGWRYRYLDDPGRNNPHLARANGISMHANMGITFDLKAIANTMPGVHPTQFRSFVGTPLTYAPDVSEVDIWVLIDGQIRFLKKDVRFPSRLDVKIDLNEVDHFLTLMVTDSQTGGKAKFYSNMDWCFWEEPTLALGVGD